MGTRYDAPAGAAAAGDGAPAHADGPGAAGDQGADDDTERTNLDLWRSIDRGNDPTA
jgi:hypothetical protein